MKNPPLKILFGLTLAFCGAAFAAAEPTPSSTPVESVSSPAPVVTLLPTPTWAPVDADFKALLEKANALYYDYHRLGLHKFQCQVQLGVLDDLKKSLGSDATDPKAKAIGNLKFTLSYDEKTNFHFTYSGFKASGDAAFDQNVMKVIDGSEKMVLDYCRTWKSMDFDAAFDLKKSNFKVAHMGQGYEVDELRDNTITYQTLDGELLVEEVRVAQGPENGKGEIILKPQFLATPQGYLANSISADYNDGYMKEKIDTDYAIVGPFEMPATVKSDIQIDNGDKAAPAASYHLSFEFSNYQVN